MSLEQFAKDALNKRRESYLNTGQIHKALELSKEMGEKIPKATLIEFGEFYLKEGWTMAACQAFRAAALFEE